MLGVLDTFKPDIIADVERLGLTYDQFKEMLVGVYAAETSTGTGQKISNPSGPEHAYGELQIVPSTFRDEVGLAHGPLGPNVALRLNTTVERLQALSDDEVKALLLDNNTFNYMVGATILITKLQANQ